jgi:hypothetical protein
MFRDEEPRRRPLDESANAASRLATEPADRHARRLGVLGHVERRPGVGGRARPAARLQDRRDPARLTVVAATLLDPASSRSVTAMFPPPTIAA